MQSSYLFLCLIAIVLNYASSAVIKQQENPNVDAVDTPTNAKEIEQQIRDYVNQMREREQLALLQAMRERSILANVDPRDYYETAQNEQTEGKFLVWR